MNPPALLSHLLAVGVFLSIHPLGLLCLGAHPPGGARHARLMWHVLAVAAGSAIWSLVLLASAATDHFSPALLGTLGWLMLGVMLVQRKLRGRFVAAFRGGGNDRDERWSGWAQALLAVLLACSAWLYAGFPTESILVERDEGVYTVHALHLLRTGDNHVDIRALGIADSPTIGNIVNGRQAYLTLPGIYPTELRWTFRFSSLPSAWMAQFIASTGQRGIFRFNAALGTASIVAFLALALTLLPAGMRGIALFGVSVFALNPAQVWVSRINLSEPLGQWFTLTALLAALVAFERKSTRLAVLGGVLFGLTVFSRIDALLGVALVMAAYLVHRIALTPAEGSAANDDEQRWRALVAPMLATSLLAAAYYRWLGASYWQQHQEFIDPLLVAISFFAGATALLMRWRDWRRRGAWLSWACAAAGVGLVLAFAYAAFVRPGMGSPATFISTVDSVTRVRDYREISLVNLGAYTGLPILGLALAGSLSWLRSLGRGQASAGSVTALCLFVGCSVVFLWQPMVSPDHAWAVRRFVPVVIPGFILLACHAVASARLRFPKVEVGGLGMFACAAVLAPILWSERATLTMAEDRGVYRQVEDIAATLRHGGRVYLPDAGPLAEALEVGFGIPVVPLRFASPADAPLIRTEFERGCSAARPCTLLTPAPPYPGLALGAFSQVELRRGTLARTPYALSTQLEYRRDVFTVARVTGLDRQPARVVGNRLDLRFPESGFSFDESGPTGTSRWTTGAARLRVPALPHDRIEFRLQVPDTATRHLRLSLDGRILYEGTPAPGDFVVGFEDASKSDHGTHLIGIDSDTFTPVFNARHPDLRTLGVKVLAIRLLQAAPDLVKGDRYQARLGLAEPVVTGSDSVSGRPTFQLQVRLRNTGDRTWPDGHDPGQPAPVGLGVFWIPRGATIPADRPHEQHVRLPFPLAPGDEVVLPLLLSSDGLADGDYDIVLSPVHESVAWFVDAGVTPLRVPVRVGSDK